MRLALLSSAAVALALSAVSSSAHAQDDASKPPAKVEPDPDGFVPLLGASVGFVDGTRRLGFSADVAVDLLVRRTFGAVGFTTGLRPHFERFGLGKSDDYNCSGNTATPCASGSALYLSHTAANAFSLEVPLVAELRSVRKSNFVPFVGVSPWLIHLRSHERARGILPDTTTTTTDASNTFFALGAFAGVNIYVAKNASLMLRAGWRFAPDLALPGGSASVRGESVNIGYRVEL